MDIGKTVKHTTVVPVKRPVQQPEPVVTPAPEKRQEPVRQPEPAETHYLTPSEQKTLGKALRRSVKILA